MTVRAMAANRQAPAHYVKQEATDPHHPHQQQGPQAQQQNQPHYSRPSSIVQQHHPQPPQGQQHSAYQPAHGISSVYQQPGSQHASPQSTTDGLPYYTHSPYSTPGATSGYTSADTSEMMAAAQMPRHPYPPMQYHTPQSNSPASVASTTQHDQHRGMYGQPSAQPLQQSMYYQPPQPQYQSITSQAAAPSYAQQAAAQHPAHQTMASQHQTMTSQPAMMMAQTAPQNPMAQHQPHQPHHTQQTMSHSPRPKMEPQPSLQIQKPQQPQSTPQSHGSQNGSAPLSTPTSASGVNPNAAPGPIPATTPLVVRQDNNGVQWIAFEYSRDRVKMEYTIRCDVESVNTDELSPEFKTDNCVYPRACCPKDQYRGNRQVYETECNTVGWALAQLNPSLRGKRGLIQRAVDSWRNSNQDPRLRSRRVRRMAKMTSRKNMQSASSQSPHLAGHAGPAGMAGAPASMGPGPTMGKPLGGMAQAMHHGPGHGHGQSTGDEVGEDMNLDSTHHHHQSAQGGASDDVRPAHVFQQAGYSNAPYPSSAHGGMPHMPQQHVSSAIATSGGRRASRSDDDSPSDLFPDIPEAKKRKFILVEDNVRGSRLRVRVTLEGVNTKEIPDSFRKGSSVYPKSFFPREMQSPPPSATGTRFFDSDVEDDGVEETEGREASRRRGRGRNTTSVRVPIGDNQEGDLKVPKMRRGTRGKEVRLNELGYRMAWLQSRVFAGRTVFLQRALDCYRNKTRSAIESMMQDVQNVAPHYETRIGKRRWNERMRSKEGKDDE